MKKSTTKRKPELAFNDDAAKRNAKWIKEHLADASYSELIENSPILEKAQKLVDGRDKSEHYGPPEEFMRRLAKMWGGYLDQDLKPTDAAMMMALLKAARLRTNPDHEDSLVDFAGYCRIYERVK